MLSWKSCQQCIYKNDCRAVFEQLGKTEGPSVAIKAVLAFLLPLVAFVCSLVFFERILRRIIASDAYCTIAGFLLALSVVFVIIFITKFLRR